MFHGRGLHLNILPLFGREDTHDIEHVAPGAPSPPPLTSLEHTRRWSKAELARVGMRGRDPEVEDVHVLHKDDHHVHDDEDRLCPLVLW